MKAGLGVGYAPMTPRKLALAVVGFWLWSASAAAQTRSLAILGLASDASDEEVAAELSSALRSEAELTGAFTVASTRAALSQMTMAQDCEIAEPACRAAIGKALGVEQVLYGKIGGAAPTGREVELRLFTSGSDAETVARRAVSVPAGGDFSMDARALLNVLRGEVQTPSPEQPAAEEPPAESAEVSTDAEQESEPSERRHASASNDWLGYTLLGVTGVSVAMTVFSWIQIDDAASNKEYNAYRTAVGQNSEASNACDEANAGRRHGLEDDSIIVAARNACARGQTFEVLQYVFLGVAAASAGFGIYFLLDDESSEKDSATATTRRLTLEPAVGLARASLSLTLRY